MQIGIQSNIWGPEYHREKMPEMLAEIARAGYAGIEIGAHRFDNLDQPGDFLAQVQNEGLHVSGIHTLIKLYKSDSLDYAKRAAEFTKAVNSQFMLVSGEAGDGKNQKEHQSTAEILNQVGELCQQYDLIYVYHNHWFEIIDSAAELRALCELTDPELVSLCLDIGWVERAEASVVDVTTDFLDRIAYFHLKDTQGDRFVSLGDGMVDFPNWLSAIEGKGDFYLTYERDEFLPTALESAIKSRKYLRTLGL